MTMRSLWDVVAVSLVTGCVALCGCGNEGTFCMADFRPGITIRVTDAATGLPAACGSEAWLVSGEFHEDISATWGCGLPDSANIAFLNGAGERPGIYSAIILKNGYVPWLKTDLVVREDDCHVRTVVLEAKLEPLE